MKTPRERAQGLLAQMTLREKVGQLNQRLYGFACYEKEGADIRLSQEFMDEAAYYGGIGCLYGLYRADPWSARDYATGLSGAEMKRAYNLAQRYVLEHSRLGIPMLTSSECPHGHQALDGWLLPVNLAVGAAWNPVLTRQAYAVCGRQLKELGVDFALISMLDILRDPRWGRSEECYGEDPFLAAALAGAAVEGCQGAGVAVVAKHFCAQGETTGGVNASAARIGPRELREIHLPAMGACCKAGVQGVMAAYNEIDGQFCHANRELLRDILREELGFTGIVMADGVAIDRLDSITGSPEASAALALQAGVQLSLWDRAFSTLESAVEKGLVKEEEIDAAVLPVLELKFARGLFEQPFLDEEPPTAFTWQDFPQSLELARQSPVLLKNNGLLPLQKPGRVAVIGPNGDSLYNQLGDYTPPIRPGAGVTLLEGLRALLGPQVAYAQGCPVCGEDPAGLAEAVELARQSDLVVLALGGSSSRFAGASFDTNGAAIVDGPVQMDCGEGVDSPSLRLPGLQERLAEEIARLGKPVVAVVIAGRPYVLPEVVRRADALVYAFYPGPMGGQALAELLTGRVCPSGRLPASLPGNVGGLPCYYNHKASYTPVEPALYPFGFGLSYTQFRVEDPVFPQRISAKALAEGERVQVRFTLRNTGCVDGAAVPMLFLRSVTGPVVGRVKELKGFEKVFLPAGEERACVLSLGAEELAVCGLRAQVAPGPREVELWLEEGGQEWARGRLTIA